jgi:flagellar biosynthesis protein FlhG
MTITSQASRQRPSRHPASEAPGRNIITILSGKGGVGKTMLAAGLSQALAGGGGRTLLFDGDLGLANIDIQLGLMAERDLGQVVGGSARLKDIAFPFEAGGFDIIAGNSGSGLLGTLGPGRLGQLRDELYGLARDYDHVVLDMSAGIDVAVRTFASGAGPKLVVTTEEPTALTDAYAVVKVTHGAMPEADLRIVVNMAGSVDEGMKVYEKLKKACEGFLKLSPPLAGIVRRDARVPAAIRAQTALLTRSPNTDAARDIEAIAERLAAGDGGR